MSTERMRTVLVVVASLVGMAALAGCRPHDEDLIYIQPNEPPYLQVPEGPPGYAAYPQSVSPGPDYVWVDGYWNWDGQRYDWRRGGWQRRPQAHTEWVAPNIEQHERGYRYRPGYWRGGEERAEHERGEGREREGGERGEHHDRD